MRAQANPVSLAGQVLNVFEYLSLGATSRLFTTSPGFQASFSQAYAQEIIPRIGSPQKVVDLGQHLREVFFAGNKNVGRLQGQVSGAGNSWERLVAWYISAVTYGTPCYVAHRTARSICVPKEVNEALKVSVNGKDLRDDNDVLVLVQRNPDVRELKLKAAPWHRRLGIGYPSDAGLKEAKEMISSNEIEVIGLACKTNYNDSVNSGLFWNFIYSSWLAAVRDHRSTSGLGFDVGSPRGKPQDFGSGYQLALATVPTQKDLTRFNATSAAVVKASLFSGGAYWGAAPTAFQKSLDHFFTRHNLAPTGTRLASKWSSWTSANDPWGLDGKRSP